MKAESDKTSARYYIAKLLMNALYGRFGLNPEASETLILDSETCDQIIRTRSNVDISQLKNDKCIISYNKAEHEVKINSISVPVSSAIAAQSRVSMTHYLTKYSDDILYVDTDGIKTTCELDADEVDDKVLGKMKLEYTASKFVGLAPKVYGVLLNKPYQKYQTEMVKIKGYSASLSFAELEKGLDKNYNLKLNQDK